MKRKMEGEMKMKKEEMRRKTDCDDDVNIEKRFGREEFDLLLLKTVYSVEYALR